MGLGVRSRCVSYGDCKDNAWNMVCVVPKRTAHDAVTEKTRTSRRYGMPAQA